MPQSLLERRQHVPSCLSPSTVQYVYVWAQHCFDAANQPESSHWLIGYNYSIRAGGVLREHAEVSWRGGIETNNRAGGETEAVGKKEETSEGDYDSPSTS